MIIRKETVTDVDSITEVTIAAFKALPISNFLYLCQWLDMNSAILYRFCLPFGKPRIPHLLRCRGFAVDDYSFTLGRLGSGASSAFTQLR